MKLSTPFFGKNTEKIINDYHAVCKIPWTGAQVVYNRWLTWSTGCLQQMEDQQIKRYKIR